MALALAVLASLSIGTGEFFAGRTVRHLRPAELTAAFFAVGIIVAVAVLPVVDGAPIAADLGLGAGSGVLNGFALFTLYKAYEASTLGLAAPITGMITAMVPVTIDLVGGTTTPSILTAAGFVVGIGSIGLTSYRPGTGSASRRGVTLAVVSGLLYGFSITMLGRTDIESGMWPVLPQRMMGFLVVAAVARLTGPRFLPERRQLRLPILVGVLGSLGVVFYAAAAQRGSLGAVAVAGSQFAAVAVLLAFVVGGERLAWWQSVGVAGTAGGVALIAVG